ncbi:ribose 5-phosphate isomerase B [Oceanidesulfovibrio indonesiensis]|jgi:ribose 5-phosphate isomerase B|uniref:Ribose 5-phosphate isomerase B n=1 Tax=Oceanidesulfovibrio indonesiensis TaxID=54767 RepID=A0A7M3MHA7_9BACT|nr:ribose 5-phosphate isomerase B [Oceanidesulfovibrio indonesiensis]TVM18430.1 ribose 5-phosphate isomerase B [Oceanidesulfovibrio indonesiensis]
MDFVCLANIVYLGSDHAGYSLKREIIDHITSLKAAAEDLGTHTTDSCDYPDFAAAVCKAVAAKDDTLGILVCGTGQGMAMTANRMPGIRAAVCTNEFAARMARAHNDANVLCLGERILGAGLANSIVEAFLSTAFEGGRHQRRIERIDALTSGS